MNTSERRERYEKNQEFYKGVIRRALTLKSRGVAEFIPSDLKGNGLPEPTSKACWGSVFQQPEMLKHIQKVGFAYSPETGGIVHAWSFNDEPLPADFVPEELEAA